MGTAGGDELYRSLCNRVVLLPLPHDRLAAVMAMRSAVAGCTSDVLAESLDKRSLGAKAGHEWPGVGAVIHALEDECTPIRIAAAELLPVLARAFFVLSAPSFKLALEGLSDPHEAVRLASARAALACGVSRMDASDVAITLESAATDASRAVRDLALALVVEAPALSQPAHVAALVWWLAVHAQRTDLAFALGRKNAHAMHGAAPALAQALSKPGNAEKGAVVLAALAGAASRTGVPPGAPEGVLAALDQLGPAAREQAWARVEELANARVRDAGCVDGDPPGVCALVRLVAQGNACAVEYLCGNLTAKSRGKLVEFVAGRRSRAPRLTLERAPMGECDVRVGRFAFAMASLTPDDVAGQGPFGIVYLNVVVFGDDVADAVCPAERWLVVDRDRRFALNKAAANVWGRVVHASVAVGVGWRVATPGGGVVIKTPDFAIELRGDQGGQLTLALAESAL